MALLIAAILSSSVALFCRDERASAVTGIQLLSAAKATTANELVAGTTLIVAIGLPIYTQYVLGEAWLGRLPTFARLAATNTVVLAVLMGIGSNLVLNIVLGGEAQLDDA